MPSVEIEVGNVGGTDDRRTIGRHGTQARPEARFAKVSCRWKQRANRIFKRVTPLVRKVGREARQFRHAPHPDAIAEARDRDLEAFVEQRGNRSTLYGGDRDGDRIALHRVNRQPDA